jgi:hypothetical protein
MTGNSYNKFLLRQAVRTNPQTLIDPVTGREGKCEHCHDWDATKTMICSPSAAAVSYTTGLCKKWGSYTRPITTCTLFRFKSKGNKKVSNQ